MGLTKKDVVEQVAEATGLAINESTDAVEALFGDNQGNACLRRGCPGFRVWQVVREVYKGAQGAESGAG